MLFDFDIICLFPPTAEVKSLTKSNILLFAALKMAGF
jgi:hypothetical protein